MSFFPFLHCLFNIIFLISQPFTLFQTFNLVFLSSLIFVTFGPFLNTSYCNMEYMYVLLFYEIKIYYHYLYYRLLWYFNLGKTIPLLYIYANFETTLIFLWCKTKLRPELLWQRLSYDIKNHADLRKRYPPLPTTTSSICITFHKYCSIS